MGVVVVDEGGEVVKHLSTTPAEAVRSSPDGKTWVLSSDAKALHLQQLVAGATRSIASIPTHFDRKRCAPSSTSGDVPLSLYEASDFVVSNSSACVLVSDRNLGMRSLSVANRVDLNSGAVSTSIWAPDCGKEGDLPTCTRTTPSQRPVGAPQAHTYHERSGVLSRTGEREPLATLLGKNGEPARILAASDSGALLLLGAFSSEGDYTHWAPLAVDLHSGFAVKFVLREGRVVADDYEDRSMASLAPFDIVTESTVQFVDERHAVIEDRLVVFPVAPMGPQRLPAVVRLPGEPVPR